MSKKIMLALAAVSAAVFAMPAVASAEDLPLHLNPTPAGAQTIDDVGANPTLSATGGSKFECGTFSATAMFEAGGTTGHMNLKFGVAGAEDCKSSSFTCNSTGAAAGIIETTELPFHLVKLANEKPGILVTPNPSGSFAHIECAGGLIKYTIGGNGLIGTFTEPACEGTSNMATIDFNATATGVQEHKKVAGTETEYTLKKGTENTALDATGTLTLSGNSKLECT